MISPDAAMLDASGHVSSHRLALVQEVAKFQFEDLHVIPADLNGEGSDSREAVAILQNALSDPKEAARLAAGLSRLRQEFSYENTLESPYTPLDYARHNKLGFVPFNESISVLETTESFRRHIVRVKIALGNFVYMEIKIPGNLDTKQEVSDNDFSLPQEAMKDYGDQSPFQRPLMKIEAKGSIELYGQMRDYTEEKPFRMVVFEYRDAKRFYDVPPMEWQKSLGLRITDDFLKDILMAKGEEINEGNIVGLERNIMLQVINVGALILDMDIAPMIYRHGGGMSSVISDFHIGNLALTKDGKVYFVSDNGSLRKVKDDGWFHYSLSSLFLKGTDGYWLFNHRTEYLSELVGYLSTRWQKASKGFIEEKVHPVLDNHEIYVEGERIGSEEFHRRFSMDLRFYQEYMKRRDAKLHAAKKPGNEAMTADHAMNSQLLKNNGPGGVDLTPVNMNLQTQNRGSEIKFHLDSAMLQQLQNAPGFVPVIINIQPLKSLPAFLGISEKTGNYDGVG